MTGNVIKDDSPTTGIGIGDKVTITRGAFKGEHGYVTAVSNARIGLWEVAIVNGKDTVRESVGSLSLRLGWLDL